MTAFLAEKFGYLMDLCYAIVPNYVLDIILFTLITKVILLPISLWCQKNSLKMVALMPEINRLKVSYYGDRERIGEEQAALYKRERYHPLLSLVPLAIQIFILMGMIGVIHTLAQKGAVPLLGLVPATDGGWTWLMPLGAGLAAVCLSFAQNRINPLQREQSKAEQWFTNGISIAISLILGVFVTVGVALYWICSNLFSILVQLTCNVIMRPSKYVDYHALRESKAELDKLASLGGKTSKELQKREKADYKRFFSIANKHLVFYSEASGFYKYFQDVIEELLQRSNIIIHYVTSDPNDQIFKIAEQQTRIKPYYIGEKRLVTLFMKMDADMVVMTMPDLDNFHIKRSYVRKDVEYVYMFHGLTSFLMVGRTGCLNHYDTIFCVGQHQVDEIRVEERMYGLPAKKLVECGYGLLDRITEQYRQVPPASQQGKPQILIAPSWQKDNIIDSCIVPLLNALVGDKYHIIVRPHPEYVKRFPDRTNALLQRYQDKLGSNFEIQTDFSNNGTVYRSDLLITDWSSIAHEFSYATKRPSLFINTPMKVLNPDYVKYPMQPLDLSLRKMIGHEIALEDVQKADLYVSDILVQKDRFRDQISHTVDRYVFHLGESGKFQAKYIIGALTERQGQKKNVVKVAVS